MGVINRVIKEINWTKSVSIVNSIGFLSLALEEYTVSHRDGVNDRERDILRYSALLLLIAGGHYAILDVNQPSEEVEMYIRYSDWLFTTPLLLMVLGKYYGIEQSKINVWIVLDLVMILGGIIYEKTGDIGYWWIGTIAYLFLLGVLYRQLPEYDLFVRYFVVGWGLYGLVALMPVRDRFFYFNLLDFYNKFVFAYDIRLRLLK